MPCRRRRRSSLPAAIQTILPMCMCLLLCTFALKLAASLPLSSDVVLLPDTSVYAAAPSPRHRFYANDSLLGVSVPCTDEEKQCLRYNRVLLGADGRCYPLGDGPRHCRFAVDRYEFEKRGGHLRGYCAPTDLCRPLDSFQVQVAYTNSCMKVSHLIAACGPGPVNLIQHFFGGTECAEVQSVTPPEPLYIPQPATKGRCVFPNFRHDLASVSNQEARSHFKRCSREQSVCFASKKVFCEHTQKCCSLLEEEGCGAGRRVVLSRAAWEEGDARVECAPVNPCGEGARLMAFDRQCYGAATLTRVLCPGGVLLPNAFGEMSCVTRDFYRHVVDVQSSRPESCELQQRVSFGDEWVAARLMPECGLSEGGSCVFI